MSEPRKAPDRDLLIEHHRFPGVYTIKAFGPATGDFEARVRQRVLAEGRSAQFSSRLSSRGGKVCVTIELQAQTVDDVISTYERLHELEDLKMIL